MGYPIQKNKKVIRLKNYAYCYYYFHNLKDSYDDYCSGGVILRILQMPMCITEMRENKVHCTEKIMDAEIRNYLCWIRHVFLYLFMSAPFYVRNVGNFKSNYR